MQKRSSKSESKRKTEQNRSSWKILTTVKVNGQRLTCADVAGREAAAGAWVRVDWRVWGAWQVPAVRGGACSWGRNFSRRVEARVMQFLAILGWVLLEIGRSVFLCLLFGSWMHRTLISECCRTMGVTAMARFWQWRLDEGEGSRRTPEMSTGTRKSEEWLWYHVNNIKWERKTE